MSVRMIVLAKQVPDPEGPPTSYEVNEAEKRVVPKGIPPVINPFDENALEAALLIKEQTGGEITLLSLGKGISRAVILKAMASGADSSLLVEGDQIDPSLIDSAASAALLAAAVREQGEFDLILCGRQASDTNAGQVGLGVAFHLGIPAVTLAQKVEVDGDKVVVERVLSDGYEIVETPMPALITVSGEVGELRYPSLQAIKAAKSLPQAVISAADLEMESAPGGRVEITAVEAPSRERRCSIIEGDSPEETGRKLAEKLREDRVV